MPTHNHDPHVLGAALDALDLFDACLHRHDLVLTDQLGINTMTREILLDLSDRLDLLEAHVLEVVEQLKALRPAS